MLSFLHPAAGLLLLVMCAALSQQQAMPPAELPEGVQLIPDGFPCSVEHVFGGHTSCASGFCNYNFVCGHAPDSSWCHNDDDCASGKCSGYGSGLLCPGICGVFPDGALCAEDSECYSGQCMKVEGSQHSFCRPSIWNSEATRQDLALCSEEGVCDGEAVCNSFDTCGALPDGAFCNDEDDCQSQVCSSLGVCGTFDLGHMCTRSQDCRTGFCSIGSEFAPGVCVEPSTADMAAEAKQLAELQLKADLWVQHLVDGVVVN